MVQVAAPAADAAREPRAGRRLVMGMIVIVSLLAGGLAGGVVAGLTRDTSATRVISESIDIPAVVTQARPAVVIIDTTSQAATRRGTTSVAAAGTGFVLRSDGIIATNAHVVAGATTVTVTLADGSTHAGTVIGTDTAADLAVVKIAVTGLPILAPGSAAALRVGDHVVTLGNALGMAGGPTVSAGILSATDRTVTSTDGETLMHMLQTDAAINPGDSGGPLVNANGEVVGINTLGSSSAENIGFAISIDTALPILNRLVASAK